MTKLTIFTPTFNRAYTLHRGYEGLKKQNCKDFRWLIIDDGSTDNTRDLVEKWKSENNGFEIQYVYKSNGGMHTAHNVAIKLLETEICVCIDSDDSLADNAVAEIISLWDKNKYDRLAAIVGLDAYFTGGVVGRDLSDVDGEVVPFCELRKRGDKKYVFRTSAIQEMDAYPEYFGENLVPLGTLYYEMNQKYDFMAFNNVFAYIEYMPDGSTKNIYRQYIKSPMGFAYSRKIYLKYEKRVFPRFMLCIQYVSSCIISKGKLNMFDTNAKALMLAAIPFGIGYAWYIRIKTR